jgi:hypothetical protein
MYNSKDLDQAEYYNRLFNGDMKSVNNQILYNIQTGVGGEYNPNRNELWASESKSTNRLHEYTHSLNAIPQELEIKKIIPTKDKYWDNPSEIYSRLMEFRKTNNISPTRRYSLDEIKVFKNSKKNDKLFDRYTVNQLYMLLNNIAQKDSVPDNFQIGQPNIT